MARRLKSFILAAVLLAPLLAFGAAGDEARSTAPALESTLETAPVEIDGQVLFTVRGLSSFPAEKRAQSIGRRIEEAAADAAFASAGLKVDTLETGSVILAGKTALMVVTDADAQLEQTTRENLAALHLARIRQAVDEYRLTRSTGYLIKAALHAAGATGLLAAGIAVLLLLNRWLDKAVSRVGPGKPGQTLNHTPHGT